MVHGAIASPTNATKEVLDAALERLVREEKHEIDSLPRAAVLRGRKLYER
jgi:hypothetical protein